MRRNPNLELSLLPPSVALSSDNHHQPMLELFNGSPSEKDQNNQQLVIFYNGTVSVCEATEIQARAIILLAKQEMDEKSKTPSGSEPSSPLLSSPTPTTGLAMKKSLQQFLLKRKNRIQATSPYNH